MVGCGWGGVGGGGVNIKLFTSNGFRLFPRNIGKFVNFFSFLFFGNEPRPNLR